jgi:tRNA (adenine57-N1/adenine58-N1)-methyltransferase
LKYERSETSDDVGPIQEDSYILVYRDKRRRWIVRPKETPNLHTHLGILDVKALVGKQFGIHVKTSLGDELLILKPTLEDMVMKFSRQTQVIYPKDFGLIIAKSGIHSGSRVIEAGTGSGAATAALAYIAQPDGHIYSYDINEAFQEIARKNLEKLGLLSFVTLKLKDAKEGFDEGNIDVALIDLGDPWEVVQSARRCLGPSGVIVAVTPTTNQAERLVEKMKAEDFAAIETIEVLIRNLEARAGMTRPSGRMIGHTAYITFGRKTTID